MLTPSSFQLAGRILLIFLFVGFIFQGSWSIARVLVSVVGLGACIMVAVGFKAKYSASFLVALLSIFNVLINNWYVSYTASLSFGRSGEERERSVVADCKAIFVGRSGRRLFLVMRETGFKEEPACIKRRKG
jgi:hypothetical protein